MPKPTPSPSQLEAIQQAKALALAGAQGAAASVAAFQTAIVKYTDIDNFAKANFDYLNDNVIRKYELERRWMDGQDIALPVSQTDLDNFVNTNTGRCWNNGAFELKRVPEFDGGPLTYINDENETKLIQLQDEVLSYLQNGVTGMILFSATTVDALSGNTVVLHLDTSGLAVTIGVGDRFLVKNGSDAAVVEVTSFSQSGSCSNPTYTDEPTCIANAGTWTMGNAILGIKVIIKPQGTLPGGSQAGSDLFDGFNNTERTNKSPSNPWEQGIMATLLQDLQDKFNRRLTVLNSELTAITGNEDPNMATTPVTYVNNSIASVSNFLGNNPTSTIDISDSGIISINSEKGTRLSQISSRITAIASAITAGTFYDQRYNEAVNRTQLANGTMVQLADLNKALAGAQSGQSSATALAGRYDNMIR